jgi:folate-binding protein YgfZ
MLDHFGVLAVRGVDARKFLQGQLSQDVLGLRADQVVWAGLHNPQGRTLALLRLVPQGETDVLCVLPRELLANALTVLRKYLLRAKATLTDESAMWQIVGLTDDAALARDPGSARHDDGRILWRHASDGRVLALEPHGSEAGGANDANGATDASAASGLDWLRADIAAGLPELTAQTSGEFVAQMLNLDALGGISFNKGCYTGQEVIARAHYRGRVKRRAQRFALPAGELPAPGASVTLADGRSAQVLLAAPTTSTIEILAVAQTVEGDTLTLPLSYPLPE